MQDSGSRYILTIATGKPVFLNMAVNLARSFLWWHPETDIKFRLVTDMPSAIAADIAGKVEIVTIKPGEHGVGFTPKLYLDKLAIEGQTLFIDSDCLIYGKVDCIFEAFKGHKVSVVGNYIAGGEWFGNIDKICKRFKLPHIPKFNGGIYYLENGAEAKKVYELARKLEREYDEIGFVRLRNRPNDEVLMALAMQMEGCCPTMDNGAILGEFVNFQSGVKSDLLNGEVELYNKTDHPRFQKDWHLAIARPLVVHFLGHHSEIFPYTREVKLLEYIYKKHYSPNKARVWVLAQITLPYKIKSFIKNFFRPLYRFTLGTRPIRKSERIID